MCAKSSLVLNIWTHFEGFIRPFWQTHHKEGNHKLRWMLYWRRFPKLKPKAAARSTRPRSLEDTATTVRKLASAVPGPEKRTLTVEVLAGARDLATRVGDKSNLALDPDLNSYYVQNIVVKRMPTMLSQMGELQSLLINWPSGDAAHVRPLLLAGMSQIEHRGDRTRR